MSDNSSSPRGMLSFRLFDVSVTIQPISWIMLAIIGGGLGVSDKSELMQVLFFVVAGMLTLLVHEFGHALIGRYLTGAEPTIIITGIGGVTYNPVLPRTRAGYFAMVAAGPLASLLLGLVVGLFVGLCVGAPVAGLFSAWLLPLSFVTPAAAEMIQDFIIGLDTHQLPIPLVWLFLLTLQVSFWWSVLNLLPIYPLDGGKLLDTLLPGKQRICASIGVCFCAALVLWNLLNFNWFNILITGYLAYLNFQYLRDVTRR